MSANVAQGLNYMAQSKLHQCVMAGVDHYDSSSKGYGMVFEPCVGYLILCGMGFTQIIHLFAIGLITHPLCTTAAMKQIVCPLNPGANNRDYQSGLGCYNQLVSSVNFSEISSFMPGIKTLLNLGNQLRV